MLKTLVTGENNRKLLLTLEFHTPLQLNLKAQHQMELLQKQDIKVVQHYHPHNHLLEARNNGQPTLRISMTGEINR